MARLHPDRAKLRLQRLKDLEEYQRDYYARKHRKPPTPILPKQEEKVRAKLEKAAVQPLTRKERLAPFHQLYKKYPKNSLSRKHRERLGRSSIFAGVNWLTRPRSLLICSEALTMFRKY